MPWELHISASDLDLFRKDAFERDPSENDLSGWGRDSAARAATRKEPNMDEAAFTAFYQETSRPLFGYLLRVSGERTLAEDLLQESYCRLLSADLPLMDQSQIRSYLFRVASNLLRDRWRRNESPAPENMPEQAVSLPHPDLKLEMRQAFRQLKPRERELLWLAYVEGSNHKEIADTTGLRASSIRLLLFRARRKLADLIRGGSELHRKQRREVE